MEPKRASKAATAHQALLLSCSQKLKGYVKIYTWRMFWDKQGGGLLPSPESVTFCWPCETLASKISRSATCKLLSMHDSDCKSTEGASAGSYYVTQDSTSPLHSSRMQDEARNKTHLAFERPTNAFKRHILLVAQAGQASKYRNKPY